MALAIPQFVLGIGLWVAFGWWQRRETGLGALGEMV